MSGGFWRRAKYSSLVTILVQVTRDWVNVQGEVRSAAE